MIARKPLFFAPFALATAGLTACASLLGGQPVKVRPVENLSSLTPRQTDLLYESAVTAIDARDYARALDYLHQDKSENPNNIKVLNALGVVYDKLGRFDLSARYYGQAQAIDPNSRIVAANVGYSKVLQGWQGVDQNWTVGALQAPVSQSAPTASLVAIQPAEAGATVHPTQTEATIFNTVSPQLSLVSAPAIKPAQSPIVVVSIPPEIVAPVPVQTLSAGNLPNSPARKRLAMLATPEMMPAKMAEAASLSGGSALAIPPKLPAVIPAQATAIALVARPADKPSANASAIPRPVPEPSKPVIAPPIEPATTLPIAVKQPVVPTNRSSAVLADNHPVQERSAALSMQARTVSEPRKIEGKAISFAPPTVIVAAKPHVIVPKAPAPPPDHLASATPLFHLEKKQAAVPPVTPPAKPLKLAAETQTTVPVALRGTAAPAAPVKFVTTTFGNAKVLTTGKPVKILNASGKPGEIGALSHRLAVLGWTVRQSDWRMQPTTTLYYPAKNIVAAKAMVRTLPFPVHFSPDNDDSFAMRLVIGRDFISWKPKNGRLAALWQRGAVVASLQKPTIRGVR